jgi:hypothetical protein
MFDVICVLKSGGIYNAEWVRKLRDGVARNLSIPHRFRCLSDVDVPCERIPLEHDWKAWWSKIELFRPGVITGPTIYFDLDTVITGSLDGIETLPYDFAALRNFHVPEMIGSGVMWFRDVPHWVYERFSAHPDDFMLYHEIFRDGPYLGDQAFIWDSLDRDVDKLTDSFTRIRSYKYHCKAGLPEGTSVVCFHGEPRPPEVKTDWMREHWR